MRPAALANKLGELGRALAELPAAFGPAEWAKTVVVVVSEFGRTMRENGARGTDHGHGSVYLVLGGSLAAQPVVVGEQVALRASNLNQNRDLPVLNEYRAWLGGIVALQFGLGADAVQSIFPATTPRSLGLI